jgi:hypothetical protein
MSVPEFPDTVPYDPQAELNSLISDEVLRARVQKVLAPSKPQNLFKRNLDQILLLVLGFGLTWGVGTILTKGWEQSRVESTRKLEQERRETDARIAAFTDFLGTISEQHARSLLVNKALQNGAPLSELAALVKSEQEIFAESQNKTGVLTFTIRQLLDPQVYTKIKTAMDDGLIEPLRRASTDHGYMYYEITNGRSTNGKVIADLSPQIPICSATLTHAIWYNAIALKDNPIDAEEKKNSSLKQMEEDCRKP